MTAAQDDGSRNECRICLRKFGKGFLDVIKGCFWLREVAGNQIRWLRTFTDGDFRPIRTVCVSRRTQKGSIIRTSLPGNARERKF